MYEQRNYMREEEERLEVAAGIDTHLADAGVVEQAQTHSRSLPSGAGSSNPPDAESKHGECCEDCRRTCRRNFWTSLLNAVIKVSTIILAGFGLQSFNDGE